MEQVSAQNASLTGQVMLYNNPELLSRELHGKLGLNPSPGRFTFAAKAHICPLTVPEFGPAALSYPVIFVGPEQQPVVVMGLEEGQNLYANAEEGFDPDAYIPCYIRRYPFVLAQAEPGTASNTIGPQGDGERMLVGIDRGYPYMVEGGEYRLFENGEPTEYTKNCIQYCNDFETQHRMTLTFVQLLKDLDLLETRSASYQPQNADGTQAEPITIAQFFAVSEAKLNELPAEKLVELRTSGALSQIYAHLHSLSGWERLIVRAMIRANNAQPQAANA